MPDYSFQKSQIPESERENFKRWKLSLPINLQMDDPNYDLEGAFLGGLEPIEGHLGSRSPVSGKILKSRFHQTYGLAAQGESDAGFEIFVGKDGAEYSKPIGDVPDMAMRRKDNTLEALGFDEKQIAELMKQLEAQDSNIPKGFVGPDVDLRGMEAPTFQGPVAGAGAQAAAQGASRLAPLQSAPGMAAAAPAAQLVGPGANAASQGAVQLGAQLPAANANAVAQGLQGAAGAAPGFGARLAGGFTSPLGMAGTAAALATTDFEDPRSIGASAGGIAGGALGQALIPIPVVGAMVGSTVGQFAGEQLGGLFGEGSEEKAKKEAKKAESKAITDANMKNIFNNLTAAAQVSRNVRLRHRTPTGFSTGQLLF